MGARYGGTHCNHSNHSYLGGGGRRTVVQGKLGKSTTTYLENKQTKTKTKKTGGVALVIELLSSKHEALSLIPSTKKERKKEKHNLELEF
jgi:hypothetical protein